MTPEEFKTALKTHGIELDDHQMAQFETYYQFLVQANQYVNLTAITEQKDVYLKHFYDSLLPAIELPELRTQAVTLCDVGAGAGFPSLPLKIAFPQLKVTIVDSLNKRIKFLEELVARLGLQDVELHHARAEEFAGKKSKFRESFELVTARAVARMSVLAELCLPLVRLGGQMIALKAQKTAQELADAQKAIQVLGGKVENDIETQLPETHDQRNLVILQKVKHTPKQYPRKAGTPARNPIS
ncbi:MAG TPA: 16S rRNA (guanine(527)-N(7))-methyltransferase RsmG [Candidatus Ligilactobacillus excrementigallinarum]|uniref:Ribosomal RNA small subunit methyltransferase G n=1 Tax=Candidatus Ligilactobacillus excrementigallinarum TaxID=2838641 RepID=A0A9D1UWW3_9LACO|nr:16S rRNA (guanine(527)-N(7))-methyltransferase RsmG [Candidatus Ligilactobacillus excrementigallinarum]